MSVSSVSSGTIGNYYSANKTATASSSSAASAATTTSGSGTTTSGSGTTNTGFGGGMNDFLKLFTTQLKYQNPTSPMDTTNFTSQLAQMSSVEQLTNLNTNMKALSAYSNSLNNITATSLIGKSVVMNDKTTGVVTGVKFDKGITYLTLDNGNNVQMGDVKEIKTAADKSTTTNITA
jgi:flagellar basal-body rod modification protein FlgD